MKTMCPPGYHHSGFVTAHALWMSCHKATVITKRAHCFHDCIYIYIYYVFSRFTTNFRKETYELMLATLKNHDKPWQVHWIYIFWNVPDIYYHRILFLCRLDQEKVVLPKGAGFLLFPHRRHWRRKWIKRMVVLNTIVIQFLNPNGYFTDFKYKKFSTLCLFNTARTSFC